MGAIIGFPLAFLFGFAASIVIGVCVLLLPFAWLFDVSRQLIRRFWSRPH
jgi:hypothetical protein